MDNFTEISFDIFKLDRTKYVLAHCISANCAFGKGKTSTYGVAAIFTQEFPGIRDYCLSQNPKVGDAILFTSENGSVYNLVTKELHWHKPTYYSVQKALHT